MIAEDTTTTSLFFFSPHALFFLEGALCDGPSSPCLAVGSSSRELVSVRVCGRLGSARSFSRQRVFSAVRTMSVVRCGNMGFLGGRSFCDDCGEGQQWGDSWEWETDGKFGVWGNQDAMVFFFMVCDCVCLRVPVSLLFYVCFNEGYDFSNCYQSVLLCRRREFMKAYDILPVL